MLKVLIAIDSMKGSLGSVEGGEAIAAGVRRVFPDAICTVRPLSDGGEGTVVSLVEGLGGEYRTINVTGPLGDPVRATYGIVGGDTAVMEMAEAAGITLIAPERRDARLTTTYGVGEMILSAVRDGCRRFIVGIGGSATNDAGAGMLQALGYRLLDSDGAEIPRGGAALAKIASIDASAAEPALRECVFKIACDVENPLCGPSGASAVFGPQKGAAGEIVTELDAALSRFADVAGGDRDAPGAGAAGGLGFAFMRFLSGALQSGVKLVLDETRFDSYVENADIVVTGEGRLDAQTAMGKAPAGVAAAAKRRGKNVIAFAGVVSDDASALNDKGIDAFFPIIRSVVTLEEALDKKNAAANLAATAEQVFRCLRLTVH